MSTTLPLAETPKQLKQPDRVDIHVGYRIRQRRNQIGMSQERLAELIGVTFQQVQKYERAANRVSSSVLYRVAEALTVPIQWFFEGLEPTGSDAAPPDPRITDFLNSPEGRRVLHHGAHMSRGRRMILSRVARDLDAEENGDADEDEA